MSTASLPLLTIGLITRNADRHLDAALRTLAQQPQENTEVLVVDGQSTDRSLAIIHSYASELPLRFVSEPDEG